MHAYCTFTATSSFCNGVNSLDILVLTIKVAFDFDKPQMSHDLFRLSSQSWGRLVLTLVSGM